MLLCHYYLSMLTFSVRRLFNFCNVAFRTTFETAWVWVKVFSTGVFGATLIISGLHFSCYCFALAERFICVHLSRRARTYDWLTISRGIRLFLFMKSEAYFLLYFELNRCFISQGLNIVYIQYTDEHVMENLVLI